METSLLTVQSGIFNDPEQNTNLSVWQSVKNVNMLWCVGKKTHRRKVEMYFFMTEFSTQKMDLIS